MTTAVFIGEADGCANETFTTGPNFLVKNDLPTTQDATLGAIPERIMTPANTCTIPNTAKEISSGCTPESTGAIESGNNAHNARQIPIAAIVLRPVFRICQPFR